MMRTFATLLIGMAFGIGNLNAQTIQNPGYLGHKTSVHIKGGAFPALQLLNTGPSRNAVANGNRRFRLAQRYQAGISTSVNKSMSFEAALHFIPAAITLRSLATDELEHFLLNAWGGGVGLKFFPFKRKGAMAPIGPYTELDFIVYSVTARNGIPDRSDFQELYGRSVTTSFALTFGKEFVVEDKLMIGVGCRYAGNGLFQAVLPRNSFQEAVANRLLAYSVFNLQLSLGYLL